MEAIIKLIKIEDYYFGISDEPIKEGDWMWNQWKGTFEGCFGIAGKTWHKSMKKVICCTNPKNLHFPYLVMPDEALTFANTINPKQDEYSHGRWYGRIEGYNANPAKFTQEQMEKAIFQAKLGTQLTVTERYSGEDGVDNLTKDILQSLSPTAKSVVVEMEESYGDLLPAFGGHYIYKLKVDTSSEHSQGIVRAIEVIY